MFVALPDSNIPVSTTLWDVELQSGADAARQVMLNPGADCPIWLCTLATDMRRSFDGLSAPWCTTTWGATSTL